MDDNIERQLDDAVTFLNGYWLLHDALQGSMWRIMRRMLPHQLHITSLVLSGKTKPEYDRDALSGRRSELVRTLLPVLATQKERESPVFEAFINDYTTDYISRKLEEAFPSVDFGKIKKLHDSKKQGLEFNATGMLGIVLGASSLVLNTVPQKVVETSFRMDYADFEVGVFWFTIAVIVYVGFLTFLLWSGTRQSNHKHKFISQILEYTSIRKGTD